MSRTRLTAHWLFILALWLAASTASEAAADPRLADIRFSRYEIVDRAQGGLVVATIALPQGWAAQSAVDWDYTSANNPARVRLRLQSPDGSAWVESYPREIFSWLNVRSPNPLDARVFGMINHPNIGIVEAMQRFVIGPARGNRKNLQVVGARPLPNLAQRLGGENIAGDSVAIRVRYEQNGQTFEEDFYGFLSARLTIPYDGPQGRTYEYHRTLAYVHSLGARQGQLDAMMPLLGFVAASGRPNPVWRDAMNRVSAEVTREFNRQLAAGYAQIAAAGRVSRAISANNDAMLASMSAQRARSNAEYAARRQASTSQTNSDFDSYIRGTEKMNDPYWGTSEHSYTSQYHWTDGQGRYQHSNDAGFNPNVGGTGNWTLMSGAR